MKQHDVIDLSEVREIRQVLLARPPAMVHGTLYAVVGLLATGVLWSFLAKVDEVVEARGRVRAMSAASLSSGGDDHAAGLAAAQVGGRVLEVCFRAGDRVEEGQVLVRLDTRELRSQFERVGGQLESNRQELGKLEWRKELIAGQHDAARAQAEAELAAVEEELDHGHQRRARKISQCESAFERVDAVAKRTLKLWKAGVIARQEVDRAVEERQAAWDTLREAKLPLDERRVEVARRQLDMVAQDYALRQQELDMKLAAHREEWASIEARLAKLERELAHCEIKAPFSGLALGADEIRVGSLLQPGAAVAQIASEEGGYRLDVALSGADVGLIQEGMPVQIRLDAYDYQLFGTLPGELVSISPDSQMTEQGQVVYMAKVRLLTDVLRRGAREGHVRLGMGASAQVVTGRNRILALAFRKLLGKLDWTQRAKA